MKSTTYNGLTHECNEQCHVFSFVGTLETKDYEASDQETTYRVRYYSYHSVVVEAEIRAKGFENPHGDTLVFYKDGKQIAWYQSVVSVQVLG